MDLIDRQAAIDALESIGSLDTEADKKYARSVFEALPYVQPKRTEIARKTHACDCISREDVEQTVEDNILCYTHSDRPIDQDPDTECHKAIRIALGMLRKDLRKLPSAQPERKRGEWTDDNACPFCGFQPWYERDIHTLSFCPNCGADMRGESDDIPIEYFESGGI